MFSFLTSFFANPLLVAGTFAGSIPVIIHLLNKQRFKKVVWAAMHWLWASYKKSQRRLQIEQLILLLIRILILVLLALALAHPLLREGMGLLGGRSSVHRVIVLDNSYSMGQRVGGSTLFQKARDIAADFAEKLSLSDEVDVVLANTVTEELTSRSTLRKQDVINQIRAANISDGGTDIPRAIAAACRILNDRKSKNMIKEIVVVTDQTRAGWETADHRPRTLSGDDETAVQKAFSDKNKPRVLVVRVPGDKDLENIAAVSLEVDEKVVPANAETLLIGTLQNFGDKAQTNVKAKLKINGEEVSSEMINVLEPNRLTTVNFRHAFSEAGSHAVAIELEADALPNDNTAFMAVDVEQQMRVLCVDGQQRLGANSSEMDYFRQALSPSKVEEVKAGIMPLYPEVISDGALHEANLDNYRLVVLANVGKIPTEKIQALDHFVKRGGSLWIFTGERVDPTIYNTEMLELMPMTLGELSGTEDPDAPGDMISDGEVEHPAIVKFKGIRGLPLSHLKTYRRYKLLPKNPPDVSARTVLRYENSDVAVVEKTMGEGRVMLVGTTADKAWNNWPGKNHYMPLMNFIALHLIQPPYIQRNRMYGERFILQLARQDLGAARREGIRLTDPNGEQQTMDIVTEQFRGESTVIRRAGVYSAQLPGDTPRTLHFAANRNVEESDLTVIEDREVLAQIPREGETADKATAGYFKGLITQGELDLANEDLKKAEESLKKTAGSREIWRWLATTVLVLLLIESFMARRFGDFTR